MRDVALRALDTARMRGASYADVRIVEFKSESVTARNKNVEGLVVDESLGFGVRVIVDGYWGFAASNKMSTAEADRVAAEAVKIARASSLAGGPKANIGPPLRHVATYKTPIAKDPFSVSLEDKIALLLKVNATMGSVPQIVASESNLYCQRELKTFASSEGAFIEQELYETGCGSRRRRQRRMRCRTAPIPTASGVTRRRRVGSSSKAGTWQETRAAWRRRPRRC